MRSLARHTVRLSSALLFRGSLMLAIGAIALTWPTIALLGAMFASVAVLASTGAYEVFIALRARPMTRGWMIPMAEGAACVGLAGLTLFLLAFPLEVVQWLVAAWLALYAALTGALALALWPTPRTRQLLIAWTALNLLLALLLVTLPMTIVTVLYAGAAYAVAFGSLQVAAALWIRQVVLPRVADTSQTRWNSGPRASIRPQPAPVAGRRAL